jgi:hypothetical protein
MTLLREKSGRRRRRRVDALLGTSGSMQAGRGREQPRDLSGLVLNGPATARLSAPEARFQPISDDEC